MGDTEKLKSLAGGEFAYARDGKWRIADKEGLQDEELTESVVKQKAEEYTDAIEKIVDIWEEIQNKNIAKLKGKVGEFEEDAAQEILRCINKARAEDLEKRVLEKMLDEEEENE